jgi:hypothetical protein
MPLWGRSDGTLVKDAPLLRRFMPYLMPGRTEASVLFDQRVDLSHTLAWIERHNEAAGEKRYGLFTVVLAACVRTLAVRPHLNRFVVGRRLYQRDAIELSFAVKKQFTDAARLSTVKITFQPADTLDQVAARVKAAVQVGKGEAESTSEKEMKLAAALPGPLLRFTMWLQRQADAWNLLPASMIQADPLYASLFAANLGSIGIDAAYHHLFEYGTVPLFMTVGTVKKAALVSPDGDLTVRDAVDLRFTFDERVVDGFYCAEALRQLQGWVERPETLL